MRIALGAALALATLALSAWVWKRSRFTPGVPRARAAWVALAAAALAIGCQIAERALWRWTGLALEARPSAEIEALLAMFLFAAPLEEGAKVASLWPLYRARRLLETRHALVLSGVVGAAFGGAEAFVLVALGPGDFLTVLRASLATAAHVTSALLWGTTLSARAKTTGFALAWCAATLLRGLFDHIVLGRGPGLMVLGLPLLLTLAALAYAVARRTLARDSAARSAALGSWRPSGAPPWSEAPSVRDVWRALEPKQQPLMMLWIVAGTLVTAGLGLVALAAGIYAGRAMGLDFAAADEADVRSNGPLLFLATSVGCAFPIAGYLVARASGTRSVLEPALGSALAVLGAVLFLSVTTPMAAIFALALTPIAFALAAGGAWFGTGR